MTPDGVAPLYGTLRRCKRIEGVALVNLDPSPRAHPVRVESTHLGACLGVTRGRHEGTIQDVGRNLEDEGSRARSPEGRLDPTVEGVIGPETDEGTAANVTAHHGGLGDFWPRFHGGR